MRMIRGKIWESIFPRLYNIDSIIRFYLKIFIHRLLLTVRYLINLLGIIPLTSIDNLSTFETSISYSNKIEIAMQFPQVWFPTRFNGNIFMKKKNRRILWT